jgi:hypothetical protein
MPIEHRIRQLVEEALDSDRTPGEVCRDCPELLDEVRQQWERVRPRESARPAWRRIIRQRAGLSGALPDQLPPQEVV